MADPSQLSGLAHSMYDAITNKGTLTGTEHLHPSQFGKHAKPQGKHAGVPSFGERVRQDMARRQGGFQTGQHQAQGRHAKPYNAESDIQSSMTSRKRNYRAKHDVLSLDRKPAKGKVTRTAAGSVANKKKGQIRGFRSRWEGKNAARLKELVK